MPSLTELAQGRSPLSADDVDWLHALLGEWQLLADLSFADLVLWLPLADGAADGFLAVALMRPVTGPTVHHEDVVGTHAPRGRRAQLDLAYDESRICRERDPDWPGDVPVREETIPVVRAGRPIAVISRHTDLGAARTPSRLELTYLRTADDLALMIAGGRFPLSTTDGRPVSGRVEGGPRVGDGLLRLDAEGRVRFASPNAVSAYRRLGLRTDLAGERFGALTARLVADGSAADDALARRVGGRLARETDVDSAGVTLRLRVIPLERDGDPTGALVLLRDVTEVRRRERELVGKEATIREIHHRVKNNLQTVAALLRLQGRRLDAADVSARSALAEAERRVGSIALVHETLSRDLDEQVDFDEIAERVGALVADGHVVRVVRSGSFGRLAPEIATPLSLVLVELVQNAAEHGLRAAPGSVLVDVCRERGTLVVDVSDDAVPAGAGEGSEVRFDGPGLGLQIVRTLVESELGGEIAALPAGTGGARVQVRVPLSAPDLPAGG